MISTLIGVLVGAVALFIPEITERASVGGHLLAGAISGPGAQATIWLSGKDERRI